VGRRLGQHFLADANVAARIADAATTRADEPLLEIGGGRGALTRHLVGRGPRLVVAELDHALAASLAATFGDAVEVLQGDAVELDLAALAAGAKWSVVGNLPYYHTAAIVTWLCRQAAHISQAVIMVQAEVADRLQAGPGTKDFGRLSVLVQYHAEVDWLCKVPPGCFRPPPKVQSAVVRLTMRARPVVDVPDEAGFFALVEAGFRWRRKALGTVLRTWLGRPREVVDGALAAVGIDPTRRAETLSLDEFAQLARQLAEENLAP